MKRVVIAIILVSAFLFFWMAYQEQKPDMEEKKKVEQLRDILEKQEPEDITENHPIDHPEDRVIDFGVLKQINPDIVGWIYIPETAVDYPILKNPYDNYYLNHDFTGNDSLLGAIFMQKAETADFSAQHTVLYGHNLIDKQMFGSLSMYASQQFRDSQPYIYIYQPDQTLRCTVYAAYTCEADSAAYQLDFQDMPEFESWVMKSVSESYYTTSIQTPNPETRILTLSTCTDTGDARFVLHSTIERVQKK